MLYPAARRGSTRAVCLVAFSGHYTAASVQSPQGRIAGPYAVVVETHPGNDVLGTVILRRLDVRFGHTHIGP
jgi:hypothetical protein